jgi:hypothetical protein
MIRESEYLPETQKPLSAELKGGGDTWIYQGIPDHFMIRVFFCLVVRLNRGANGFLDVALPDPAEVLHKGQMLRNVHVSVGLHTLPCPVCR